MLPNRSSLRFYVRIAGVVSLLLIWLIAVYELARTRENELHEAEVLATVQSQVFAEYSESTIKRINELLLDLRSYWSGDWKGFAELVQRRQENIADIAFQVAVIDKEGRLAFSNLAKSSDRTDLSEREHFRVHKDAVGKDRLFISKPVKGKVSGKWSIQFTRPVFRKGEFYGVIVISVSPEQFASFGERLQIVGGNILSIARNTGEIMVRYPAGEQYFGMVLRDLPSLQENGPTTGSYRRLATTDGQERIYGYRKLPAYGLVFIVGTAVEGVLEPYRAHRNKVIGIGVLVSLAAIFLFFSLLRSLAIQENITRELEQARDQAEAASKAKSAFLANMSHEMRTPLHHVFGFAQLLGMKGLSPEQNEWLQKLNDATRHLEGLIGKVIELSRLESEQVQLLSQPVDVAVLLQEVAAEMQGRVQEKGLELTVLPGQLPACVLGDVQRLKSALIEYVDNAIKYTEVGGIELHARAVEEDEAEAVVRFEVADTGPGIPDEVKLRLFGKFEQADNSMTRKHGGLGIGLVMTKRLAECMGGDAGCESAIGKGSVFWFTARLQKG